MAMLTLSSGPYWRLVVEAAADMWAAGVETSCDVRSVALDAGPDGLLVAGATAGRRVDAAWVLTGALGWLIAADPPLFAGVGATVTVGRLSVEVPAVVLAGVVEGRPRAWWAARVAMRVG